MPRKGPATKRQLVTDPVYGSPLVTALANKVLKEGKRSLAERIVYGALGQRALALLEHLVRERGNQRRAVDRIGDKLPLRRGTLARHQLFSFFAP